jgi:hypothetical protein
MSSQTLRNIFLNLFVISYVVLQIGEYVVQFSNFEVK